MRRLFSALTAATLSTAMALAVVPGGATADGYRLHRVAGPSVSLDQAVRRARRSGKVLSADTVEEQGRRVHRVRVLTERGQVRRFRYDAHTGQPVQRGRAVRPGRR